MLTRLVLIFLKNIYLRVDSKLWRDVIESDINGFFNLVHHSLPELRASRGSIVLISSAGLFRYPPGDALSVAPKATIEHLIKGIAKEEGVNGVRSLTQLLWVLLMLEFFIDF